MMAGPVLCEVQGQEEGPTLIPICHRERLPPRIGADAGPQSVAHVVDRPLRHVPAGSGAAAAARTLSTVGREMAQGAGQASVCHGMTFFTSALLFSMG